MKIPKNRESKLSLLSNFFRSVTGFIWVIILLIVLAAAGRFLLFSDDEEKEKTSESARTKPVLTKPEYRKKVDESLAGALETSRKNTEEYASVRLQEWVDSLMVRVDNNFIDWYFGYFTQQMIGLKSLVQGAVHLVFENQPSASEKLTEEFQEEFGKRVLRKEIAQLELERITREIISYYSEDLQKNVNEIPDRYQIPQGEWDRYLEDISIIIGDAEATRNVSITMKTVVAGGIGGTLLAAKLLGKITVTGAKVAGKAGAKIATKTGAKVAAKMGGKMIGMYVGVGIIVWDLWDHYSTAKTNRPILRQNLYDYLTEAKESLLYDTETGIITTLLEIENNIKFK